MPALIYIKLLPLLVNFLCLVGLLYGKKIYNREVNPVKIHYFSITMMILFGLYLLIFSCFSFSFLWQGRLAMAMLFFSFVAFPFVIGAFGNNYQKARTYINMQLTVFAGSMFLLLWI